MGHFSSGSRFFSARIVGSVEAEGASRSMNQSHCPDSALIDRRGATDAQSTARIAADQAMCDQHT
jgi:hypothetical protein